MALRGRVGRHFHLGGRHCQNWPEDQRAVIALLNLIPVEDGGAGGGLHDRIVSGLAGDALYAAILRFEDRYYPGQRSGFVDPDGPILKKMEELAARPSSRANGPPPKNSPPTPARIKALDEWLQSITEGHPMSKEPWTFYEEIDAYLGPFGPDGYPIGYGKKYCVLFNSDERLRRDPEARAWVRRTTVLLQTYLSKFVLERYRNGTLGAMTEKELREAAFDSHPLAYTRGGLTLVALISPGLVPHISAIPRAEFSGPNRAATWRQFFTTAGLVIPEAIGDAAATLAGPAHTGVFTRAADQDFQRLLARQRLADYLDRLQQGVADGLFDRIAWLNKITTKLNETEFPDRAIQKYAGDIVRAANARKNKIAGAYRRDIALNPDLKKAYDAYDPGWANW